MTDPAIVDAELQKLSQLLGEQKAKLEALIAKPRTPREFWIVQTDENVREGEDLRAYTCRQEYVSHQIHVREIIE